LLLEFFVQSIQPDIARLLRAEGLAWRIEEDDTAPAGHRLVFFADSTRPQACPEDATSAAKSGESGGIRYHGARAGVEQDSIDAISAATSLAAASVTTLSYDYKSKKIIAASVPTKRIVGGQRAPHLESYDAPGAYAYASAAEAQRSACLQMEAIEARSRRWQARSTVRTLRLYAVSCGT
jgi:uncharacterized protein involved in type VI secretion and phage assembly